jgi:hypothetical protein
MRINPLNVVNFLLAYFQTLQIQDSEINYKEVQLSEKIKQILIDSTYEFNDIEMIEEDTLDFQEEYKDGDAQFIEDVVLHHFPESYQAPTDQCTYDIEKVDFDYKKKAVEYWRSSKTKKNLSLKNVQHRYKKVSSISQLKRWAHTINQGGTYKEKIEQICQYVLENFKAAVQQGSIIHDRDLRRWALQAQKLVGNEDFRFRASESWLLKFKKAHRIVSRKINKFITKKTIESASDLQTKANEFVADIKSLIPKVGLENLYNSDQSGFQLEIHSGRTLAEEGEKQVQCVVQSVSSTTHSYTIQPLISADGRLLSPLYLVLKEKGGEFGPNVKKNLFKADNVHVEASSSGKLTTGKHIHKYFQTISD